MDKPIKIAMLIQAYHPRVGGAERQLAYLAPRLQSRGFQIHIITRRHSGLKPFEIIDGIPVHRMPMLGPKLTASLSYTLSALPLLYRLRPDVIHAQDLLSSATTAIIARQLLRNRVVATAHRSGVLGDVHILIHRSLGSQRMQIARRSIDKFITISREIDTELELQGISGEQRINIPNGVDVERFAPLSESQRIALRQTLDLPVSAPVAIFAGRLATEKRVEHLVNAWTSVRSIFPEAVLLILGTGECEASLRQMAGDGVRFAGRIEDVTPYLQVSDLFVLPSIAEGLPVSILEALAVRLPVLATRVGGVPDMIEHGQSGWLVPPDDPMALRDALLTLLNDPALLAHLAKNGREYTLRHHGLAAIVDRLSLIYENLSRPVG